MKKLIDTIKNIFSIEDLKVRIMNTLLLLLVYRIGTFIVLPGIDAALLAEKNASSQLDGLLGLINTFSGGAFERASIFALGIMPYISASIVVQLLTIAVPSFQKMQKEGEDGRRKINQITRLLTIAITVVQGISYIVNFRATKGDTLIASVSPTLFMISSVFILIAGTMFTLWLGERITDRGLGNGVSLIIMVGIISRLPFSLLAELNGRLAGNGGPIVFLVEMVFWLAVIASVILLVQGTRKIPVQYAKRIVGNKQYGGVRQYLPLKVNAAGVMPIIFAQALMFVPSTIAGFFPEASSARGFFASFQDYTSWAYNITFFTMIVLFTYGGFVPGVKPGKKTADFIDTIMSRITLPGALFLGFVAIFPAFAILLGVNDQFAQFYGGTSLLIMVGVVLDTLQQIESHLLMRHYDGLMKTGRIKGRASTGATMT
jgi:preprotein translocase subunit SecY